MQDWQRYPIFFKIFFKPIFMIQNLAYNWFLVYYFALGLIFVIQGLVWMRRPDSFYTILYDSAVANERPKVLLKAVRYFTLFTLISAFFTFFPFSAFEAVFVVMSLMLAYVTGSFLLKWNEMKSIIIDNPERTKKIIKKLGQIVVVFALTCFALSYRFLLAHNAG